MAIPFDVDPGGLFVRLGLIGGELNAVNDHRGAAMRARVDELAEEYDRLGDEDLADGLYTALAGYQANGGGYLSYLSSLAQATVIRMVHDDNPQPDYSLATALVEVIRQMEFFGETVQRSVVGASYLADVGNNGNAALVLSTATSNGKVLENLFAEDLVVTCTTDSQTGGATAGSEQLIIQGEAAQEDALHQDWPDGSGASVTITVVNAALDARAGGNLLTNSDFEDFTANAPDQWNTSGATVGTTVKSTTTVYDGAKALEFVGDGAQSTTIYQLFDDATTGTAGEVKPLTQYAVHFKVRVSAAPAAGVLRVALVDGSNVVINDEAGTANSFTVDLTTIGTAYVSASGSFRLPRVLPAAIRLQLRLITPLEAAVSMYLDALALAEATPVYSQGLYVAAFAGSTPLILGDYYTITTTNTPGGFQRLFDRLFSMKQLGLLLPSLASDPTIGDALII